MSTSHWYLSTVKHCHKSMNISQLFSYLELYCITYAIGPKTVSMTWGIPQQARKVPLHNLATGKLINREPEPTDPSATIVWPVAGGGGGNKNKKPWMVVQIWHVHTFWEKEEAAVASFIYHFRVKIRKSWYGIQSVLYDIWPLILPYPDMEALRVCSAPPLLHMNTVSASVVLPDLPS